MNILKTTFTALVTIFLFSCASDKHINEKMATGYYSEVALSLGFKFTYGYENADKYVNYQLGLMALDGHFLAQNPNLIRSSFEDHFDSHTTTTEYKYWSSYTYAREFLMKSAKAGFPPAMIKLADLLKEDVNEYGSASDWLYNAASYGNPEALSAFNAAGKEPPKLLISNTLADEYTSKGREIDDFFSNHKRYDALERNRIHQQKVQERVALIKNIVVGAAAVVIAGEIISQSPSASSPRYNVPTLPRYKSTPIAPATQVSSITSASAGFALPGSSSKVSPNPQISNSIRQVTPVTSVREDITESNNCSSDFNCGLGMKCVKAPLAANGVCLKEVDKHNLPTFPDKDPSSILPNMSLNGQCTFNTDCSIGYSCDSTLKVCVR